jgi:hypothetical protein
LDDGGGALTGGALTGGALTGGPAAGDAAGGAAAARGVADRVAVASVDGWESPLGRAGATLISDTPRGDGSGAWSSRCQDRLSRA